MGYEFVEVGRIRLDKDSEMPQSRYAKADETPLNKYGTGPFCRFSVAKGWKKDGVYVLASGVESLYVGECENLERRWGSGGYGGISPKNCYKGGQETNCRINNLILQEKKRGKELTLWFCEIKGGKRKLVEVERKLIQSLEPRWNK